MSLILFFKFLFLSEKYSSLEGDNLSGWISASLICDSFSYQELI